VRFRRRIIRAVNTECDFLRFSIWIDLIYNFTFGLFRIQSPLLLILLLLWVMLNSAPRHLLNILKKEIKEIKDKINIEKIAFYIFKVFNA
jgi:hypothetical protein